MQIHSSLVADAVDLTSCGRIDDGAKPMDGINRHETTKRITERMKGWESADVLKAAGTPMIKPLPLISLKRFTLLPGECSTRSTSGRRLPTATQAGREAWNGL